MTIEEAEIVYKRNQCSPYIMAREEFDNYIKYNQLKVDKALEKKWQLEAIDDWSDLLKENGDAYIFNCMYKVAVIFRDKERLDIMMKSLSDINMKDEKTSLCIAETIMGRKRLASRSGMIFWAYDIGAEEEALTLIKKASELMNINSDNPEVMDRVNRDKEIFAEIVALVCQKITPKDL